MEWEHEELAKEQREDSDLRPIVEALIAGNTRPQWSVISGVSPDAKTLWGQWDRLKLLDGVLWREWVPADGSERHHCLVVPRVYREDVLQQMHDTPTAGHRRVDETKDCNMRRFYWPGMGQDIERYCSRCDCCTVRKSSRLRNSAPGMGFIAGAPGERLHIDIIGPLPVTHSGHRFLIVMVDYFTKWCEVAPMKDQNAETVARTMVDQYISRWGSPMQIHTDQGRNFDGVLFNEVCRILGVVKTRTSGLRPQSNCAVERLDRTLVDMLSVFCRKDQTRWDEYVQLIALAYRSTKH